MRKKKTFSIFLVRNRHVFLAINRDFLKLGEIKGDKIKFLNMEV